jgi:preprotein translocase subunit SecA
MSKIKSMLVKETSTWVEFPDIDGFEVNLRYITREDLLKIRNSSLTYKFNKRTRQKEEEVDSAKFIEHYAEKAIADWRGLRVKHLPQLLPVDITGMNANDVIDYSEEEAVELLKNSTIFDQFVSDTLNDFEQFSRSKAETDSKN